MAKPAPTALDNVVSLAKRRGFVYPCGEIYGGTRSAWDYGPLGVELKENIKRQWWKFMVTRRDDVVGLDSSVILPTRTWEASGHRRRSPTRWSSASRATSASARTTCRRTTRPRRGIDNPDDVDINESVACPNCGTRGAWTEPRNFNMMLKTYLGVIEDESGLHYLRPETAQGIFVNFANVVTSSRQKPPFGIAQIGKSFRNEITPGNFIFRTREFEQMEIEFFVKPGEDEEWHRALDRGAHPLVRRPRHRPRQPAPLRAPAGGAEPLLQAAPSTSSTASASPAATSRSSRASPTAPTSTSSSTASSPARTCPTSTRPATSATCPTSSSRRPALTRSLMAFLIDAYTEDEAPNTKGGVDKRVVLKLDPRLAPIKVAVLPLSRNADLSPKAKALAAELRQNWNVDFDDSGAIGRRYRRQDEIGTPFCVTVDFETLDDNAVTIRERDTMTQERVSLDGISRWFAERLLGC